jgi:hypothetical protein
MSIVNALSRLKTNIFGGPGNTGFPSPPPSKVDRIGMTKTPVSSLDSDPLKFGTYQFPKDVFENGQLGHYMIFYVNVQDRTKYDYPKNAKEINDIRKEVVVYQTDFDNEGVKVLKGLTERQKQKYLKKVNAQTGVNMTSSGNEIALSSGGRNRSQLQGLGKYRKTTKRIKDSIALYLPANVQDTTAATYQDAATGVLGWGLNEAILMGKQWKEEDFEGLAEKGLGAVGTIIQEAIKNLGAEVLEGLTGAQGGVGLVNKMFGRAENPFVEVLFQTMGLREFKYNFNFAPRNEKETEEIQQIIQLFRFHMAPELQGENSRYLTLPSEFDIHYMYRAHGGESYENDYFNRIGTCVLKNVDVDYTPGKVRTFEHGAPTQITMSLSFTETELLTKEKINAGY